MASKNWDLLEILKAELNFIEKGGYGKPAGEPWTTTSVFQDSLSCLNFADPARTRPCRECLLNDLVPVKDQSQTVPCHHIPLDEHGSTIESLEGNADQQRLEDHLKLWLRASIARLEEERESLYD
jgi:hypothetical protein